MKKSVDEYMYDISKSSGLVSNIFTINMNALVSGTSNAGNCVHVPVQGIYAFGERRMLIINEGQNTF